MNKRLLFIPTAAASAALAAGSIAYACTAVQGTTTITELGGVSANCTTSGNPQNDSNCDINVGSSRKVVAEGSGARANTAFFLWFLNDKDDADSMDICMSSSTVLHPNVKMWNSSGGTTASSVTSTAGGAIASTTRYIPTTIAHGLPLIDGPPHNVHNGTASVCWMDNGRSYATDDVTILITGGTSDPSPN